MAKNDYIQYLLDKYLHESLSPKEYQELLEYFDNEGLEENAKQLLYESFMSGKTKQFPNEEQITKVTDNAYARFKERIGKPSSRHSFLRRFLPYAAALIAAISISIFWNKDLDIQNKANLSYATHHDILPGANRATLSFDGGHSLTLSENKTGIKVHENEITYNDGSTVIKNQPPRYATLSTPRKGQYQIILPDGTKVWLNAESSLSYPTAFKDGNRIVELKGEAYFEVIHDAEHPFIVRSTGQLVKVLGTSFNINAYDNESRKITTLVNGKIELENTIKRDKKILVPGEQSILGAYAFTTQMVDPKLFTAWKEGKFKFKGSSLHEVLRQFERWYDIEVDFGRIPDNIKIYGSIKRDKKLSSVLSAIEEISGIEFKLEGRRLLLMD